jgi:hypothetical protein
MFFPPKMFCTFYLFSLRATCELPVAQFNHVDNIRILNIFLFNFQHFSAITCFSGSVLKRLVYACYP